MLLLRGSPPGGHRPGSHLGWHLVSPIRHIAVAANFPHGAAISRAFPSDTTEVRVLRGSQGRTCQIRGSLGACHGIGRATRRAHGLRRVRLRPECAAGHEQRLRIWQEEDASHRTLWVGYPSLHGRVPERVHAPKVARWSWIRRRAVRSSGSTRSRAYHGRIPAETFARDPGRKAELRIVARSVSSTDVSSDLSSIDEQRACRSVPGKEVDRAALAEYRVGDLGLECPSGCRNSTARSARRGMALVHQPVERTTAPADDEQDFRIKDAKDLTDVAATSHCRIGRARAARPRPGCRPRGGRRPADACGAAAGGLARPDQAAGRPRRESGGGRFTALISARRSQRPAASNLAPALRWAIPRSTRRAAPQDGSPAVRS